MDSQIQKIKPEYNLIYLDILESKFPEKISVCKEMLQKEPLSALKIIKLNELIFGNPETKSTKIDQKYRAYEQSDILHILDYQKKNRLNNTELALHFNLSRNTIAKWKKLFVIK